jgi:adenine-specific DNA-methyltransferase
MQLEDLYINETSLSHRKKYAQYFTPEPIAELMVEWLAKNYEIKEVLEPAFGLGIFTRILKKKFNNIKITGFDIDSLVYSKANEYFSKEPNVTINLEDYLVNDWNNTYDSIICNPPYFKFQDYKNKAILKLLKEKLKVNISGFSNIYALFILKSVMQLETKGRAAFIVPSEFLNSDYGVTIKDYLIKAKVLKHVFIFNFNEKVFGDAITTSAILLLAKDNNINNVKFTEIKNINDLSKIQKAIDSYPNDVGDMVVNTNEIDPSIKWRTYYQALNANKFKQLVPFSNYAKVVRGIATGANDYFIFNIQKAKEHGLKVEHLLPCITKSKDVTTPFFTKESFDDLVDRNKNMYLFNGFKSLDNEEVKKYVNFGEENNYDKRYLTSKRNPWFALENRPPSPIWVGVFNRNGLKFIRNEAQISNLTTFHCVYLKNDLFTTINIDLLFAYLLTDIAKEIFDDNRREYGGGLKKFEPNDLNNAQMLDLSILEDDTKNMILLLYKQYRQSVLANREDTSKLKNINLILQKKFTN